MMAVKVYIVSKKEVGIINYWDEKPQWEALKRNNKSMSGSGSLREAIEAPGLWHW